MCEFQDISLHRHEFRDRVSRSSEKTSALVNRPKEDFPVGAYKTNELNTLVTLLPPLTLDTSSCLNSLRRGQRGAMDRASDYEYMNDSPAWVRATVVPNFCDTSCAPEQGTLL